MTSPTDDTGIGPELKRAIIDIGKESYIQGSNDTLDLLKEMLPEVHRLLLQHGSSAESSALLDQITPTEAYQAGCAAAIVSLQKSIDGFRKQDMTGADNAGGSK